MYMMGSQQMVYSSQGHPELAGNVGAYGGGVGKYQGIITSSPQAAAAAAANLRQNYGSGYYYQ
jgi:hypothetical protein